MRTSFVAPVIALVALLSGCRTHVQLEGTYALTVTDISRDECGLASVGGVFANGKLILSGDDVRMEMDLQDVHLAGQYLDQKEAFELDGSVSNVTQTVQGQACLLDGLFVHMDVVSDAPTTFHGTVKIQYTASRPESCVCQLWASFSGAQ